MTWAELANYLVRAHGFERPEPNCCYGGGETWRGFVRYIPDVPTGPKYVANLVMRPPGRFHIEADAETQNVEQLLARTIDAWVELQQPTNQGEQHG